MTLLTRKRLDSSQLLTAEQAAAPHQRVTHRFIDLILHSLNSANVLQPSSKFLEVKSGVVFLLSRKEQQHESILLTGIGACKAFP